MALSMPGWVVLVLSTVLWLIGQCESSLCSQDAPGTTWRQDRERRAGFNVDMRLGRLIRASFLPEQRAMHLCGPCDMPGDRCTSHGKVWRRLSVARPPHAPGR